MKQDCQYDLILARKPKKNEWETSFAPFRFIWEAATEVYAGELKNWEGGPIAHVRFYPLEKRLEIYPFKGSKQTVGTLFQVPAFREISSGPLTTYAQDQLVQMKANANNLSEEIALHDWRVALRKFRTIFFVLSKEQDKDERKALASLLKRLGKLSSALRDDDVVCALCAKYNIPDMVGSKKAKHGLDLQKAVELPYLDAFASLVADSTYSVATVAPKSLVAKQRKIFMRTLRKVHSANDIEQMHKVRKEAKQLRYLEEIAYGKAEEHLVDLQDCMGRWHDLIMFQDLLLEQKKHTAEQLMALASLEVEIGTLLDEFRSLSGPWWEEQQ